VHRAEKPNLSEYTSRRRESLDYRAVNGRVNQREKVSRLSCLSHARPSVVVYTVVLSTVIMIHWLLLGPLDSLHLLSKLYIPPTHADVIGTIEEIAEEIRWRELQAPSMPFALNPPGHS